ncbi:MAG: HlyD family type I secretion periplasmic adaptor subunit [Pseudomonadales bacterium]|nr:HlyD family type I secretion periplasmic adaptor subunit [Pseudomonadales bacterium]
MLGKIMSVLKGLMDILKRSLDTVLAPWMKSVEVDAVEWGRDAELGMAEERQLSGRGLLYAVGVTVTLLFIWSAFAEIDEVTRGEGKVIPSRQVQIIQSQDGGVVSELLVTEGQIVQTGELLIRLDRTRSESSFREKLIEFEALTVKEARLRAVIENQPFAPPAELMTKVPRIVAQEQALYRSSREEVRLKKEIAGQQLTQRQEELNEIDAKVVQLRRGLELAEQKMALTRPMVATRAVSEREIIDLESEVNRMQGDLNQALAQISRVTSAISEAEQKVQEVELVFANQVGEELTTTLAKLNELAEINAGLSDRVQQTEVRSPVTGTVKQLYFNTIGGVVMPGREMIEVVPLDDTLLMEVRIQPKDIAFLLPGQEALVKFSAYDFVVYGGLDGTVERVGADTIMDEDGNPYYEVNVRTGEPSFGQDKPIIPGMTVEVDILTGKKTILEYLMKPVLRAKQYSLSER